MRLQEVFSPTDDLVAFLWEEQQVDIWDDRRRARNPAPLCSWSTVMTVKANEMAIAAVLASGNVMAYGRPLGGGTLPDLVIQNASKWPAVDRYTSRYAFLATLSNGSAIVWGDISEYGTVFEKKGRVVEHVNSTSYAFAITWSDGSVTTWGDPEKGGNSEHVQGLLSSVRMVRSNKSAFAALANHSNIARWGDPTKGGCMEAIPARGVIEIVKTNSAFAALTHDGCVRCWGGTQM